MSAIRRLRTAMLAAILTTTGLTLFTAPAAVHACGFYAIGQAGQQWVHDVYVAYPGQLHAGTIYEEYEPCSKSVRAHFQWDSSFRNYSHPYITGAYIEVGLSNFEGSNSAGGNTAWIGSGSSADVFWPSYNGQPYTAGGANGWRAFSELKVTFSNSSKGWDTCWADSSYWNYQYGRIDLNATSDTDSGQHECDGP